MAASRASINTLRRQQGLILVVLVIVIVLAFTSYIFSELSISEIKVDVDKNTQINLKKAKQALIDYAVTYSDRVVGHDYGILPYPEADFNGDDGNTDTTVTGSTKNTNVVGWLPWRALDIPNLKDDSGTCLFYAVSGTYKLGASVQADMVNEDSTGMFQVKNSAGDIVQGNNIEDRIVALVIAPGLELPGQVRNITEPLSSCGRDYGNNSAYLEGDGATDNSFTTNLTDEIDYFIHATSTSSVEVVPYNDKFLTITRDEIWNSIVKRDDFKQKMDNLTQALALCLADYANMDDNAGRRLPWPVITNLSAADYRDNNSYIDDNEASNGYSGRFPFNVTNSNNKIWPITIPAGIEGNLFNIIDPDIMPTDPNPGIPPQPQLCGELPLTSGPDAGLVIDLYSTTSSYRKLWNNWKDHFFYVLSKEYEPKDEATAVPVKCTGSPTCIKVSSVKQAAAVIFSGSRLTGATRNNKANIVDYLEDDKATVFNDEATNPPAGNRDYTYTTEQTDLKNDIMYCIADESNPNADLIVNECP
ncbi:MAG: hypothetical protein KAJ32_10900 [Gammaproteobacteria bacterium]|nr:hypothetical protein [Gammaproteobacteria bacterium]